MCVFFFQLKLNHLHILSFFPIFVMICVIHVYIFVILIFVGFFHSFVSFWKITRNWHEFMTSVIDVSLCACMRVWLCGRNGGQFAVAFFSQMQSCKIENEANWWSVFNAEVSGMVYVLKQSSTALYRIIVVSPSENGKIWHTNYVESEGLGVGGDELELCTRIQLQWLHQNLSLPNFVNLSTTGFGGIFYFHFLHFIVLVYLSEIISPCSRVHIRIHYGVCEWVSECCWCMCFYNFFKVAKY